MERENYINDLKKNRNDRYIDNSTDRSSRSPQAPIENWRSQCQNVLETPHEIIRKNVAYGIAMGKTVNDLKADGKGGFIIHILPGEISRHMQYKSLQNESNYASHNPQKRSRFNDRQMNFNAFESSKNHRH